MSNEKINISLYEWMEDFDNQSLTADRRAENLGKAVLEYNKFNGTTYNQSTAYYNYLSWLKDKYKPDQ